MFSNTRLPFAAVDAAANRRGRFTPVLRKTSIKQSQVGGNVDAVKNTKTSTAPTSSSAASSATSSSVSTVTAARVATKVASGVRASENPAAGRKAFVPAPVASNGGLKAASGSCVAGSGSRSTKPVVPVSSYAGKKGLATASGAGVAGPGARPERLVVPTPVVGANKGAVKSASAVGTSRQGASSNGAPLAKARVVIPTPKKDSNTLPGKVNASTVKTASIRFAPSPVKRSTLAKQQSRPAGRVGRADPIASQSSSGARRSVVVDSRNGTASATKVAAASNCLLTRTTRLDLLAMVDLDLDDSLNLLETTPSFENFAHGTTGVAPALQPSNSDKDDLLASSASWKAFLASSESMVMVPKKRKASKTFKKAQNGIKAVNEACTMSSTVSWSDFKQGKAPVATAAPASPCKSVKAKMDGLTRTHSTYTEDLLAAMPAWVVLKYGLGSSSTDFPSEEIKALPSMDLPTVPSSNNVDNLLDSSPSWDAFACSSSIKDEKVASASPSSVSGASSSCAPMVCSDRDSAASCSSSQSHVSASATDSDIDSCAVAAEVDTEKHLPEICELATIAEEDEEDSDEQRPVLECKQQQQQQPTDNDCGCSTVEVVPEADVANDDDDDDSFLAVARGWESNAKSYEEIKSDKVDFAEMETTIEEYYHRIEAEQQWAREAELKAEEERRQREALDALMLVIGQELDDEERANKERQDYYARRWADGIPDSMEDYDELETF